MSEHEPQDEREEEREDRARDLEEAAEEGPIDVNVGSADVAGQQDERGDSYSEREADEDKRA